MKHEIQIQIAVEEPSIVETRKNESAFLHDNEAWVPQAYHELAEVPVKEIDLFESIEANLAQIEDLQARMRFMVREVKYLLKA
mgnify:CR=1 FL=1